MPQGRIRLILQENCPNSVCTEFYHVGLLQIPASSHVPNLFLCLVFPAPVLSPYLFPHLGLWDPPSLLINAHARASDQDEFCLMVTRLIIATPGKSYSG